MWQLFDVFFHEVWITLNLYIMKKLLLITAIFAAFGVNAQLRLVKDINSNGSSNPRSLFVCNGRLFFAGTRSATLSYRAIFATDGTDVGTVNIRFNDPNTGPVALNNYGTVLFYEYNSDLFFDAQDSETSDTYVVKLSGASNATTTVFNISNYTGTSFCRFEGAAGINNKIVFNPLWIGQMEPQVIDLLTPSNSGVLKEIYPSSISSTPREFTVLGTNCFFAADNGTNGREIWKTDGTTAGTSLYLDLNTGTTNSNPDQFHVIGTQLTFVATHPTLGREFFRTNGSGSLTLIRDINTSGDSNPTNVTAIADKLYFSASNGADNQEPYFSSGVNLLSTSNIKDINTSGSSNPSKFTQLPSNPSLVVFTANDGVNGVELWITDGSSANTYMIKDINPVGDSNPEELTSYNGKIYFTANTGSYGRELWVTDGSSTGTTLVADIYPGTTTSEIADLTVFNDELYFGAKATPFIGRELYTYKDPALATSHFNLNENAVTLSPNPAKDFFNLTTELNIEKVEVYSILGQLVKTYDKQDQYKISELSKGTYIVKVNTVEGALSKKLFIE